MLLHASARLAVLLFAIPILLVLRTSAAASNECVLTPTGIRCSFGGTTTSTTVTTLPPFRYLVTMTHRTAGRCWYWSRYPPGLDSRNPANDQAIIRTRAALPRCPTTTTPRTVVDTKSRAWDVFRSWTLARPAPRIRPSVGITNLPSLLTVRAPAGLAHAETLPDRRRLEVRAAVTAVTVDWGDGTPVVSYPVAIVAGGASHPYLLKTCPAPYRRSHPSGRNCHPALAAYPVTVTHRWTGRYRTGGSWTVLGVISRSTTLAYDVDEVVGIPVRP